MLQSSAVADYLDLLGRELSYDPLLSRRVLLEVEDQARKAGVRSRDLPPMLMARLNRMTGGKALRAYQAILVANARLAAQIARELEGSTHVTPG